VPPDDRLRAVHTVTVGTRLAGIRDAFHRAGLEPVLTLEAAGWEPDVGHALARRALAHPCGATALLCLNDRLAFGAYQAVQEAGLRIPDDVSVASFDDDEVARYLRPGLTTARIPYEEMGRRAMTLLLEGETPAAPVLVPMPLQRRGSVGLPARR
jgi:LacI family transcriptional regulator